MKYVNYLIFFLLVYVFIFILYFLVIVNPQLRAIRYKKQLESNNNNNKKKSKKKKEKKYPTELLLLTSFYKIDIEKIGIIRTLIILNIINPFIMALLVTVVIPFKENWLKILILTVLVIPTVWITYYFLAKYFKHLERKSEKNE